MYCAARRREREATRSYRLYVTDSLYAHGVGMCATKKWHDLVTPREEIDAEGIISRLESMLSSP